MLHRESRMANVPADSESQAAAPSRPVVRNWEGPIFVGGLIVILILGGIAGLRSLIALFP